VSGRWLADGQPCQRWLLLLQVVSLASSATVFVLAAVTAIVDSSSQSEAVFVALLSLGAVIASIQLMRLNLALNRFYKKAQSGTTGHEAARQTQ
jgi:hypothetical protein